MNDNTYKPVKNFDRNTSRKACRGMIRKRLHSGDSAPAYRLYDRSSTAIGIGVRSPTVREGKFHNRDRGMLLLPSLTVGLLTRLRSPLPSKKCLQANRVYMSVAGFAP